jgi:hypothetical protein
VRGTYASVGISVTVVGEKMFIVDRLNIQVDQLGVGFMWLEMRVLYFEG